MTTTIKEKKGILPPALFMYLCIKRAAGCCKIVGYKIYIYVNIVL